MFWLIISYPEHQSAPPPAQVELRVEKGTVKEEEGSSSKCQRSSCVTRSPVRKCFYTPTIWWSIGRTQHYNGMGEEGFL